MGETSPSGDVDKMVSDFLSELDALSGSLEQSADKVIPEALPDIPTEVTPRAPEDQNTGVPTGIAAEPTTQMEPQQAAVPVPAHYRNIDILLMDDVQPASAKKVADQEDFNYRPLDRPWLFSRRRRVRVVFWVGTAVSVWAVWAIYRFDLFGPEPPKTVSPVSGQGPTTPAVALTNIVPVYPARARKLRMRGLVEVEAEVDERGKVVRAVAVSGPAPLRAAAVQAVTRGRFRPAHRNGVNLKSTISVPVSFPP